YSRPRGLSTRSPSARAWVRSGQVVARAPWSAPSSPARSRAKHPEASARLSTKVSAVVMLRDQLQIHSANVAAAVSNLQANVRKDEVAVLQVEILQTRHDLTRMVVGVPFVV